MTIGERAALAIQYRSERIGTSPAKLMEEMGSNRKTLRDWRSQNINPSAYWLQQLALDGYDVIWILTGQRQHQGPEIDFDLADHEEE